MPRTRRIIVLTVVLAGGALVWIVTTPHNDTPIQGTRSRVQLQSIRRRPPIQAPIKQLSAAASRRQLIAAVGSAGARPGRARVRARGKLLDDLVRTQLPARSRTLLARSSAVLELDVVRPGRDDDSTARGKLRVGRLFSVPVTARTSQRGNRMTIDVNRARRYDGTAAGITMDVGRELLEHTWLWKSSGGTCSRTRKRTCTISVLVARSSLMQQLASEPAGQVARILRSMRTLKMSATVRGSTLVADRLVAVDTRGRRLRIDSVYGS